MPGSSEAPLASAFQAPLPAESTVAVRLRPRFDPERLEQDLERLADLRRFPQPGSHHDGEWVGLSLRAVGGRNSARPSMPGLWAYRDTPFLRLTPCFREVLASLGLATLTVRLLDLPPGGVIREHVDDMLSFWHGILRLHLPIRTHPDVELTIGGVRSVWKSGELWYGDFTLPHSIVNRSSVTRVHMVLDVLIDDVLLDLFPSGYRETLAPEAVTFYREPLVLDAEDLRAFCCKLAVPAKLLRAVWPQLAKRLGPELAEEIPSSVRLWRGRLALFLGGRPLVGLLPVAEDACALVGWGPGALLVFERRSGAVVSVKLRLRMTSRRMPPGPFHRESEVSLPVRPREAATA